MSHVMVVDAWRRPRVPIHPGRARYLLRAGHAAVWRRYPFTVMFTPTPHRPHARSEASPTVQQPVPPAMPVESAPSLRVKIDPGSKTTGLAIVDIVVHDPHDSSGIGGKTGRVLWAAELTHRGDQVKERLLQRRVCRHSRRQRHTRYRPARFANRRRRAGWLPPSLESRIQNVVTWVERVRRHCPVGTISLELAKFDTQLLNKPEISGIEYQQGTLAGYEIREYLLEKWGRRCAYCRRTDAPSRSNT
jgi:RRXRR protein